MTENEKLEIRVVLEGQVKNRFLEIKTRKGMVNNTDVIRFLIGDYYEKIEKQEA